MYLVRVTIRVRISIGCGVSIVEKFIFGELSDIFVDQN